MSSYSSILRKKSPTRNSSILQTSGVQQNGVLIEKNYYDRNRGVRSSNIRLVDSSAGVKTDNKKKEVPSSLSEVSKWGKPIPNRDDLQRQNSFERSNPQFIHTLHTTHTIVGDYNGSYLLQTQQQQTQSYFDDLEEFPCLGASKPRKRSTSETLGKCSPTDSFFQTSVLSPYAKPFVFRGAYQQTTFYNSLNDCTHQQSDNDQENEASSPVENENEFLDDNENFPENLTDMKNASISLSRQKYISNLSANAKPFEFKKSNSGNVEAKENNNDIKHEQTYDSPKKSFSVNSQPFGPKKYEQLDFRSAINYSLKTNRSNDNKENQISGENEFIERNSKDKNACIQSWRRASPIRDRSNSNEPPSREDEEKWDVQKSKTFSIKTDNTAVKPGPPDRRLSDSQKGSSNLPKTSANEIEANKTKYPLQRLPSNCSNNSEQKIVILRPDAKSFSACKPTEPNAVQLKNSSPNLVTTNFQKTFAKRNDYISQPSVNTFYKWNSGVNNSSPSKFLSNEFPRTDENKQIFTPQTNVNTYYKWHAGANKPSPSRHCNSAQSDTNKNVTVLNRHNENGGKTYVLLKKNDNKEQEEDFKQNSKMNGWRRGELSKLVLDNNDKIAADVKDKATKPESHSPSNLNNYRIWSDPNTFDGSNRQWRENTSSMSSFLSPPVGPFSQPQFGGRNAHTAINKSDTSCSELSIVENNYERKFCGAIGANNLAGAKLTQPTEWINNSSQYPGVIYKSNMPPTEIRSNSASGSNRTGINVKADQRSDESISLREHSQGRLPLSNGMRNQNGTDEFSRGNEQNPPTESQSREFHSIEIEGDFISVSKTYPERANNDRSLILDKKRENIQDNPVRQKMENCESNAPGEPRQLLRPLTRAIPPIPVGYKSLMGNVETKMGKNAVEKVQNAPSKNNQGMLNHTFGVEATKTFKEGINPNTYYHNDYQSINNSNNESRELLRPIDLKTDAEPNKYANKPQHIGRRFNPSDNILNLITNNNLARLGGTNSNNVPAKTSMDLERPANVQVNEQLKYSTENDRHVRVMYNNFDYPKENALNLRPFKNELELVKINTTSINVYGNREAISAGNRTVLNVCTPSPSVIERLGAPPPVPPRRGVINKSANSNLQTRSLPKPPEVIAPVTDKHLNINSLKSMMHEKGSASQIEACNLNQHLESYQGMFPPSLSATSHNQIILENEKGVVNTYSASNSSINSTTKIPSTCSTTVLSTIRPKMSGGTNPFLDDYVEETIDIDAQNKVSNKPAIVDPPKDPLWFYIAPSKNVKGPFTSIEMAEWFNAGYFGEEMEISRNCDDRFVTVEEFIKLTGSSSPFLESRSVPPIRAAENTISRCTNPFLEYQPA